MPRNELSNDALERAILANPYDRDAYMVYGDWLQRQGVPRGELIALQLAGKDDEARAFIDDHSDVLLGPLAEHQRTYDGKDVDAFTWKNGFIHGARLSYDSFEDLRFDFRITEVLQQLLDHPSARFLCELTLVFDDPSEHNLDHLIDVLADKPRMGLRMLHIGDFTPNEVITTISEYSVGDLTRLWPALPSLTKLIVQGGEYTLGNISLPNLTAATYRTRSLSASNALSIAAAEWPKLEELEIWYSNMAFDGFPTVAEVTPLLARTDLPALRKLGLRNTEFTDELCGVLPSAALSRQLSHLDLSMGCMSDDGARALAANKTAFTHLDSLDVSDSYLSQTGLAVLAGVAKNIVSTVQREGHYPEHRRPRVFG
jgi:uncharacterized protein (TIGR02996 family)